VRGSGEKGKGERGSWFKRLRYLRWRLRPLEVSTFLLMLTLWSVTLGVALTRLPFSPVPQLSREQRANAIYTAWNDMAASMTEENKVLEELQQNLKDNPPHLVFDPRRRDLYAAAIAAHQRQLKDLETMQKADR
jgi:hypothetical protein